MKAERYDPDQDDGEVIEIGEKLARPEDVKKENPWKNLAHALGMFGGAMAGWGEKEMQEYHDKVDEVFDGPS